MTGEGWLPGYIQDYDGQALTLVVPFSDAEYLTTHGVTDCSERVEDCYKVHAVHLHVVAGHSISAFPTPT